MNTGKHFSLGARIKYGLNIADHKHMDFIKRRLIAENGMICAICGKPIERMRDLTVDHIIPRSHGGATTYENCQLAHRLCNERKGNKFSTAETDKKHAEIAKKGLEKA